jgi:hypothetical protein
MHTNGFIKNKVNLSKCGINIRGRSSYLRINYRTTEEIRKYAFALLKGISFDVLNDAYDDGESSAPDTRVMPIIHISGMPRMNVILLILR